MSSSNHLQMICDPMYEFIRIDSLCKKIIDTPEFQRLRYLKQCGVCFLVYPSAVHTRFEHSIGVYCLASKMLKTLSREFTISAQDQMCVKIAALCHDLGHGPFSHFWETFVGEQRGEDDEEWKHEDSSLQILKHLIENNGLVDDFNKSGLCEEQLNLINNLILGNHMSVDTERRFLFEIVANKITNIDVDRFDYLKRDAHHFSIPIHVQPKRILKNSKVITDANGVNRVAFRDKVKSNILEVFHGRVKLHHDLYQHKVCKNLELMLLDMLIAADEFLLGDRGRLSLAHRDLEFFLDLDDSIFNQIWHSKNEKLSKSKHLIQRMIKRDLYYFLNEVELSENFPKNGKGVLKSLIKEVKKKYENIRMCLMDINMGILGNDPLENVCFFTKKNSDQIFQLPAEKKTHERSILVFSVDKIESKNLQNEIIGYIKEVLEEERKRNF